MSWRDIHFRICSQTKVLQHYFDEIMKKMTKTLQRLATFIYNSYVLYVYDVCLRENDEKISLCEQIVREKYTKHYQNELIKFTEIQRLSTLH
jgi:hypothetical protein